MKKIVSTENDIEFISKLNVYDIYKHMNSKEEGLNSNDVKNRLDIYGYNKIILEKNNSALMLYLKEIINPLNILLIVLSIISYFTHDFKAAIIIFSMVILGTTMKFLQERRADNSIKKLKAMVSTNSTVIRNGKEEEISIENLVPGDIIMLSSGDMIPADVIILSSKDLLLNQSSLTGESHPIDKNSDINKMDNKFEAKNICLMGSNVTSGTAIAMIINTGINTYFSSVANKIINNNPSTGFDKGVNKFTWMMIKFLIVMVPLVFLINGISKGDYLEAFLFAMAVAVGLTPEMMPMIMSVNLSKGAIAMSKKKVIIKKLNSIQNLGAMDILCTDKTGTITEGKTSLGEHIDLNGKESAEVLKYGYLNSYYHTGLKSIMDDTILEHGEDDKIDRIESKYTKIDEIPFDFDRKRMSVILKNKSDDKNILICKGAFEEILNCCKDININGEILNLKDKEKDIKEIVNSLNSSGYRVIAISYKEVNKESKYEMKDEKDLTLFGLISFFDPPKESAEKTIEDLKKLGITIKILTGDNELVTKHVCERVGINTNNIVFGEDLDKASEDKIKELVMSSDIFVKLSPTNKDQVIKTLQSLDHVVGFLGDGINDAPALKVSDVGISVNTAADIAKESSDVILLANSLDVLKDGVLEGRRVFGNIMKYTKMAASSNFGNMLSVVGASAFLPFLPMMPIQVLTNNLLYDFSQTTIPTDKVDREWLKIPRKWTMDKLMKYVLVFGPISSLFDYITFFVLLYVFKAGNNPELFHTGWFIESLFSQSVIVHVIRTNKIPFIQSRASKPLLISSILIPIIGVILTITPAASYFGFTRLPMNYWIILIFILLGYLLLTQLVKKIFIKKFNI